MVLGSIINSEDVLHLYHARGIISYPISKTVVEPILCRVVSLEKNRHKIEMALNRFYAGSAHNRGPFIPIRHII